MTVVVTGAAGHVGANLVRDLLAKDRKVRAMVFKDRRALEGLDVELVSADILDRGSLNDAFDGAEVVYHLAAHISIRKGEEQVHTTNVEGTKNVVEACLATGVRRLVHTSSVHAFCQMPFDEMIDETRPMADTGPAADYDRSKARGEREVLAGIEKGLDAVIAVPGAVLGPWDYKPSHMGRVLKTLYHGRLPALIPGGYDWVDARDVTAAMIEMEQNAPCGEKYLLTGNWVAIQELAELVAELSGRRAPRASVPMWVASAAGAVTDQWARLTGSRPLFTSEAVRVLKGNGRFSHEKAKRELGYHPRPTRETVSAALDWFTDQGLI